MSKLVDGDGDIVLGLQSLAYVGDVEFFGWLVVFAVALEAFDRRIFAAI